MRKKRQEHANQIKIFVKIGVIIFIVFSSISFLKLGQKVSARWSNDDFLDESFWNSSPSNSQIIEALYGDGIGDSDRTAYTKHRDSVGCDTNLMTIVPVDNYENTAAIDMIPASPMANTIYLLNSGTHIISSNITINGNCTAIVGTGLTKIRTQNQISSATIDVNWNFWILDNLDLHANENGIGGQHPANNTGIYENWINWARNSFNNIALTFFSTHWLFIGGTGNSAITNISWNNNAITIGIESEKTVLQNIFINNNQAEAISIKNSSGGIIENIQGSSTVSLVKIESSSNLIFSWITLDTATYGFIIENSTGLIIENFSLFALQEGFSLINNDILSLQSWTLSSNIIWINDNSSSLFISGLSISNSTNIDWAIKLQWGGYGNKGYFIATGLILSNNLEGINIQQPRDTFSVFDFTVTNQSQWKVFNFNAWPLSWWITINSGTITNSPNIGIMVDPTWVSDSFVNIKNIYAENLDAWINISAGSNPTIEIILENITLSWLTTESIILSQISKLTASWISIANAPYGVVVNQNPLNGVSITNSIFQNMPWASDAAISILWTAWAGSGVIIDNVIISWIATQGIYLNGLQNFTIKNSFINNIGWPGWLILINSKNTTIENNTIRNSNYGILLGTTIILPDDTVLIRNNIIYQNTAIWIKLWGTNRAFVDNNYIFGNNLWIWLQSSTNPSNITVSNNQIFRNGNGIECESSDSSLIQNNSIYSNDQNWVTLNNCLNTLFNQNKIYNNANTISKQWTTAWTKYYGENIFFWNDNGNTHPGTPGNWSDIEVIAAWRANGSISGTDERMRCSYTSRMSDNFFTTCDCSERWTAGTDLFTNTGEIYVWVHIPYQVTGYIMNDTAIGTQFNTGFTQTNYIWNRWAQADAIDFSICKTGLNYSNQTTSFEIRYENNGLTPAIWYYLNDLFHTGLLFSTSSIAPTIQIGKESNFLLAPAWNGNLETLVITWTIETWAAILWWDPLINEARISLWIGGPAIVSRSWFFSYNAPTDFDLAITSTATPVSITCEWDAEFTFNYINNWPAPVTDIFLNFWVGSGFQTWFFTPAISFSQWAPFGITWDVCFDDYLLETGAYYNELEIRSQNNFWSDFFGVMTWALWYTWPFEETSEFWLDYCINDLWNIDFKSCLLNVFNIDITTIPNCGTKWYIQQIWTLYPGQTGQVKFIGHVVADGDLTVTAAIINTSWSDILPTNNTTSKLVKFNACTTPGGGVMNGGGGQVSVACGNWILTLGEQCDDGNKIDWDGCSSQCKEEMITNKAQNSFEQKFNTTKHSTWPTMNCSYSDVPYSKLNFFDLKNHRASNYISVLKNNCIVQGKNETEFSPEDAITIGEIMKIYVKLRWIKNYFWFISEKQSIETPQFLRNSHRSAIYLIQAQRLWFLDTLTANKKYIDPQQAISRQEAIKLMMQFYNAIHPVEIKDYGSPYADVTNTKGKYYKFISTATHLGFISGFTKDWKRYFNPTQTLTRAELSKIVGLPFQDLLLIPQENGK